MSPNLRQWLRALGLVAALIWFLVGINWGLPSHRADAFLFGDRQAWSGKEILDLAGGAGVDPNRGADVDVNPIGFRDRSVVLNDTDTQRAEIVRRYRLYSYQPDEMITFNALRQMNPGARQLDPKLYQYGGLWVYPVGAMLKLASVVRLVDLRSDVAYYLDHPEAFGRFYVVARLYSALWGVVGVWAVYRIVRHITGAGATPLVAAACFAAMPVVVNMAHEAKPHLPGAVLMLLAVLAATNYVQTGRRRWWIAAGAFCGAAFGMVLSSLPIFVVLPLMTLLRRQSWRDRVVVTLAAAVVGVDVYFLTNPYVLLHLVARNPVLTSNLGNSAAMYAAGGSLGALLNAGKLLAEGTSPVLAAAGVAGMVALARRAWNVREDTTSPSVARRATGLLLAAPAVLVLVQFVALAAGKPGEYGRFAILPDTFLMVEAVVAAETFFRRPQVRRLSLAVLFFTTALCGGMYLRHFVDDSYGTTSRQRAAAELKDRLPPGATIAVDEEPAPYRLPPVNLFEHRIVLLSRGDRPADAGGATPGALLIRPLDVPQPGAVPGGAGVLERVFPARISWAGRHFTFTEVSPPPVDGAERR